MIPNPKLKNGGWYEIEVQWPPKKGAGPTHRMSVGRFIDDQYHLLGYSKVDEDGQVDRHFRILQSSGDRGIVMLPEGKDSLSRLVTGETISFKFHSSSCVHEALYIGRT